MLTMSTCWVLPMRFFYQSCFADNNINNNSNSCHQLTLTESLLCVRHSFKCFTFIKFNNPHNSLKYHFYLYFIYKKQSKRSQFFNFIQLVSDRSWFKLRSSQCQTLYPFYVRQISYSLKIMLGIWGVFLLFDKTINKKEFQWC